MLYYSFVIVVLFGVYYKNSKSYLLLLFVFSFVLFVGNTYNPDLGHYILNYDKVGFNNNFWKFEPAYQIINILFKAIGFSFNQFVIAIFTLCVLIINNTVQRYTNNNSFVFSLYIVFPFLLDIIQLRNFISLAIIIYATRYILDLNKSYGKYIFLVILASLFHATSLFYLIFILASIKNEIKLVKIVGVLIALIFVFFIFGLDIISVFISKEKAIKYFTSSTSVFTRIAIVLYFTFSYLLIYSGKNILKNINFSQNSLKESSNKGFYEKLNFKFDYIFLYRVNIVSLVLIPLIFMNLSFFRLFRNIYILNYILLSLALFKLRRNYSFYFYGISLFIFVGLSYFYWIVIFRQIDVLKIILENNALLTLFNE